MSLRLLGIMTQAGLAPIELQRAQLDAERQAQNTGQWIGALQSLVPLAGQAVGAYQKSVADDANTAAQSLVAQNKSSVGTQMNPGSTTDSPYYAEGVGDVAKNAVDASADLADPKPTGFLDGLGALLGDKAGALSKARANALSGIADEVKANRAAAEQQARQSRNDALAARNADVENALKTTQTDLANTQIADVRAQANARDLANKIAARRDAVQQAILGAAPGTSLAQINEQHPEFTPEELGQGLDAIQRQRSADKLNNDKVQSEIDKNEAEARHLRAQANATSGGGKAMAPEQFDQLVAHPRSVINQLDDLKTANLTAPSGMQAGIGHAVGNVPVVGHSVQEYLAPGQADYESKAAIALANVNNAMDKRVSQPTLELWTKQIEDPSLTAEQRAQKIDEIKGFLSNMQNAREQGLAQSGYKVPPPLGPTVADAMTGQPRPSASATISMPGVGPTITVRRKSDGLLGTIPASNFDASKYVRVQ